MPWRLIYTSAPRGLLSGQSGFCTVGRSADLREALAQRLEQISSYHYLRVSEAATANRNPTISAFRLLDLRGAKYYVLTRIQPCGLDFTARTNHLAQHLVFQPDELGRLPSPAAILRHWPGWLKAWQGEPRLLPETTAADFALAGKSFLPAQTWARMTGDGGRAAGLLESECVRGCYLVCPPGGEEQVLEMYCETLQLLNFNGQFPLRPWRHAFTTFLQAEDNPHDFQWRACQENTPAYKQAVTRSAPMIALRSVRVPANSLVKLAREEPKPPPPPLPATSGPASPAALSWRRESAREIPPPPLMQHALASKPARREKPAFLDLNLSIHSATLMRLGIFVAVLLVLLLLKHHLKHRPMEQGSALAVPRPAPSAKVEPPPKASAPRATAPAAAAPDLKPLDSLVSDGPTFVLAVPDLSHFSLPINSIIPLQNLLHRYDIYKTLPTNIQLTVTTNRWDFPAGVPMNVGPQNNHQLRASGGGLESGFDYAAWWETKTDPLKVDANAGKETRAFSLHFGFSSSNDGDPFRLLIVNENNPPPPLRLPKESLPNDRQGLPALLQSTLRLLPDFHLLAGRQWRLEPLMTTQSQPARSQYLYKDWLTNYLPAPGHQLDFATTGKDLGAQQRKWEINLHRLSEPLGLGLGKLLDSTNSELESFLAFSHGDLSRRKFQEYLNALQQTAPDKSWIKKWNLHFDPEQLDEVSGKFEELYKLWSQQQPQDWLRLTVTNSSGPTNYFFDAWQRLADAEQVREQLDLVGKELQELAQAYVGLCIVDPHQPAPWLEMIRFDGP